LDKRVGLGQDAGLINYTQPVKHIVIFLDDFGQLDVNTIFMNQRKAFIFVP